MKVSGYQLPSGPCSVNLVDFQHHLLFSSGSHFMVPRLAFQTESAIPPAPNRIVGQHRRKPRVSPISCTERYPEYTLLVLRTFCSRTTAQSVCVPCIVTALGITTLDSLMFHTLQHFLPAVKHALPKGFCIVLVGLRFSHNTKAISRRRKSLRRKSRRRQTRRGEIGCIRAGPDVRPLWNLMQKGKTCGEFS